MLWFFFTGDLFSKMSVKHTLVHAVRAHKIYYPSLARVYCSTNHRITKRSYCIYIILGVETIGETSGDILACIDHGFPLRYLINLVLLTVKLVPEADYKTNYNYMKRNYYHNAMAKRETFQIIHHDQISVSATL